MVTQAGGRHQQPQQQEHAGLRQPGQAVHGAEHVVANTAAAVAHHQADHVDRQEAAASEAVGKGKHRGAGGAQQQRVHALVAAQAHQQQGKQHTAGGTEDGTNAELLQQRHQCGPAQRVATDSDHAHQQHRDEDGHGVVEAGFDFQGAGDTLIEPQATALDDIEHGSGIGGADDAAQQQAEAPVQAHQPGGKAAHQCRGQGHAQRGQAQGRLEADAERGQACAQATVEQDDRQCQVADQVAGFEVVEAQAGTVHTGDHAHHQEDEQGRHAQASAQ
jgi:hypothetical protein